MQINISSVFDKLNELEEAVIRANEHLIAMVIDDLISFEKNFETVLEKLSEIVAIESCGAPNEESILQTSKLWAEISSFVDIMCLQMETVERKIINSCGGHHHKVSVYEKISAIHDDVHEIEEKVKHEQEFSDVGDKITSILNTIF